MADAAAECFGTLARHPGAGARDVRAAGVDLRDPGLHPPARPALAAQDRACRVWPAGGRDDDRRVDAAAERPAAGMMSEATMANIQARFVPSGTGKYELQEP